MNILESIKEIVEESCKVDLSKNTRVRNVMDARRIFSALSVKLTSETYCNIGDVINRTHCSIVHHVKTTKDLLKTDKFFAKKYNQCSTQVTDFMNKDERIARGKYLYHLQEARKYANAIKKIKINNLNK